LELAEQVLMQLLQPTFFYSSVLLVIALFSSLLLLRINPLIGSRWRSVAYVLPLFIPLFTVLSYPPSLLLPGGPHVVAALPGPLYPGAAGSLLPPVEQVISVTGLLIVVGLMVSTASLITSALLGDRVASRLLKVVELGPEDYPALRSDVASLAKVMGVAVPRLGLVEDLRPNAFTFGNGKRSMVVFSLGILELLDADELRAVAAHELAHIKNDDIRFKRNTRALVWLSFFNPASHLAARAARREREKLADETAREALDNKDDLLKAIEKVNMFLEIAPERESVASRIGLGFGLSIVERTSLLSDHPSFADRCRSYRGEVGGLSLSPAVCAMLSILIVVAMALTFLSMGEVRAEIIQYSMGGGFGPLPPLHPHLAPSGQLIMGTHHIEMKGHTESRAGPPTDG
jgi:Zn-dependent protease with chaperone function